MYSHSVDESGEIFAISVEITDVASQAVCRTVVTSWKTNGFERFLFDFVGIVAHPSCSVARRRSARIC
jgi:hypothetical protein